MGHFLVALTRSTLPFSSPSHLQRGVQLMVPLSAALESGTNLENKTPAMIFFIRIALHYSEEVMQLKKKPL